MEVAGPWLWGLHGTPLFQRLKQSGTQVLLSGNLFYLKIKVTFKGDGFKGTNIYGDINVPEEPFAVKYDDVEFNQVYSII